MTSQVNPNVRLVRCPKCRHVLGELVEVPIYRCGGCGAILQAKRRGKDVQGTESKAHEDNPKHVDEIQNTSDNPIAEESCLNKFPKRVDSTTDDRREPLGEINKSGQLNDSDAITSDHGIIASSTEARARTEEEEGKLPSYQYGAGDQDKDSENSASVEIFQKNEVENTFENPITEESCINQFPKRVDSTTDDGIKSVSEIDKSGQLNGSDAITYDHEIKGSSTEAEECTEEEEGKLPLNQYGVEDHDKDSKTSALNDTLQKYEVGKTSENPVTEESCTDKFPERIDSTADDVIESLGVIDNSSQLYGSDAITCHEIEGSSTKARAPAREEEVKLPLYQYGAVDKDKGSKNSASNEILSSSELNQQESSLVPQVRDHESESSLEIETQSRHSSSECNGEGEKEVPENDLKNATENSSAGIETNSPGLSEDNSDGGKKELENELQNTSENPFSDNKDLEKVRDEGNSSADSRKEWIGSVNPLSSPEIADLSLESMKPSEADKCEISFNQSGTEANYKSGDNEKSGDVSITNEVLSSPMLNHLENDSNVSGYHMYGSGKSLLSSPKQMTGSGYSSPENDNEGKIEHPSQVEGVDENTENHSILRSTNAEPFLDTETNDQIFTANSLSSEGVSSNNILPPRQKMQQVENGMVPGFRHVSSDDTLENMSHIYAKGDLAMGVTLRSSTSRNYYAYDDSTSSNETDNEVPDRCLQLSKRSLKDVGPSSTKVLPEKSKFQMNLVTSNEPELQRQLMNSESSLHGKKHSALKVSRGHQDHELLQRARYRSPVKNRIRNETDYYGSRPLFSKYSSQADRGNSSSSKYGQNDFSALPDNPPDLHRLELLRMVYELQDQLKRTQISDRMPHERFSTRPSKGNDHHFAEHGKNYSDLPHYNYHEKYRRDISWLKRRELLQMAVPEEPPLYMHRVDCLCLRCCSREQHLSAQVPPHAAYYSEKHFLTNARQTSRRHRSASSSPHGYATSEFSSYSQDTNPDDQGYIKHKEARIHHTAKRHFQPIAGGAPFVACYHCSEILQLPAESLLFRRRCHQLKCGACSKVLKFSLESKTHVVQFDLTSKNSSPSKMVENTHLSNKSRENDHILAEPAASGYISDSFSRSHSTGDNFSVTPRTYSPASSSNDPKEGIKSKSTRKSVYKFKSSMESFKSARSVMPDSEHSCSESEVESPLPGSALHKLMGYSSIRRLVFQ